MYFGPKYATEPTVKMAMHKTAAESDSSERRGPADFLQPFR